MDHEVRVFRMNGSQASKIIWVENLLGDRTVTSGKTASSHAVCVCVCVCVCGNLQACLCVCDIILDFVVGPSRSTNT
jgi:hypothetical protein